MSYIRSLSNPEGLYVWGDFDGKLTFSWGGNLLRIDKELFHKVAMRWYCGEFDFFEDEPDSALDSVTEDSLSVKDIFIPAGEADESRFVIRLTHETTQIDLWPVTWYYLVDEVVRREKGI